MGIQRGKVLKATLIIAMSVSIFSTPMVRLSFSEEKQAKTVAQIVENYGKAVVLIATIKDREETIGQGSGFIVSPTGVIVTNLHVIEGAYPAVVKLINGDLYDDISIVDTDPIRDIAIIKVKGWNFPTVKLGNSDNLKAGQQIVVIGNPEGLENTVSDGLISGIRDTGKGYKMHQISAPISPGSSGSPVFNMNGEVIGVATSSIIEGQNLNFSVPINYARSMISETPKMTLEEFAQKLPEFKPSPLREKKIASLREFLIRFNEIIIKFFTAYDNAILGYYETYQIGKKKVDLKKFTISSNLYRAKEQFNDTYIELKELNCNIGKSEDLLKIYEYEPKKLDGAIEVINETTSEIKVTYLSALEKAIEGTEMLLRGSEMLKEAILREDVRFVARSPRKEGRIKLESSVLSASEASGKFQVFVTLYYPELKGKLLPFMRTVSLDGPYIGFVYAYSFEKIMVMDTDSDSPAEKAGLKHKDLILGVHNGPSFPSIVEYRDYIKTRKEGDIVPFLIDRDGEEKIIRIKLGRLITMSTPVTGNLWFDLIFKVKALYQQGRYSEGVNVAKEALKVAENTFGPDDISVATSLSWLAELYRAQGKYAEAEPLYKRALAIEEKALGPDHIRVATSLNNLAELHKAQGKYAEAEPLYKRALAIKEKVLGPDHPDVATFLNNNLAELYRAQGKYAEAEPLYKRALEIYEKVLGPDHPYVATVLENMAGFYKKIGNKDEAERLEERAKRIRSKNQ